MDTVLWLLALVAVGVIAIGALLGRVSEMGGTSNHDVTEVAQQVMGEVNAFRGSRSLNEKAWDGKRRLAPPTDWPWV
jgi:hypothetical protein